MEEPETAWMISEEISEEKLAACVLGDSESVVLASVSSGIRNCDNQIEECEENLADPENSVVPGVSSACDGGFIQESVKLTVSIILDYRGAEDMWQLMLLLSTLLQASAVIIPALEIPSDLQPIVVEALPGELEHDTTAFNSECVRVISVEGSSTVIKFLCAGTCENYCVRLPNGSEVRPTWIDHGECEYFVPLVYAGGTRPIYPSSSFLLAD